MIIVFFAICFVLIFAARDVGRRYGWGVASLLYATAVFTILSGFR